MQRVDLARRRAFSRKRELTVPAILILARLSALLCSHISVFYSIVGLVPLTFTHIALKLLNHNISTKYLSGSWLALTV